LGGLNHSGEKVIATEAVEALFQLHFQKFRLLQPFYSRKSHDFKWQSDECTRKTTLGYSEDYFEKAFIKNGVARKIFFANM